MGLGLARRAAGEGGGAMAPSRMWRGHELKAEITEQVKPPHQVAVSTNAPEDATPERWEVDLPENADTKSLRAEWTPKDGGSVVVAVALVG